MATPAFSGEKASALSEADWLDAHFESCATEYRAVLDATEVRPTAAGSP